MKEERLTTENPLGYKPIMPLIIKYGIPSVLSMLAMTLYNIVDQIFIGNVIGVLGNAATTAVFPTVTFTTGISMLLGIGTAANFSINQGAGKIDEAKEHVITGISSCIYGGLFIFIVMFFFRRPILVLCGARENVMPLAYAYLSYTCFGLPFHVFTHSAANIIRADGSPRYAMASTMSGVFLNIALDWLFMYPLNMGIEGAALATVIGQLVSFTVAVLYFRHFKAFDIHLKELGRVSLSHLIKNMKTGIPNFCNHMLMMTTNIVLNNVLVTYGALSIYGEDIPLAISGIAAKVNTIMVAFAVGTAQGCQPIWGFNKGAKKYDRVKGTYIRAFMIAFAIGAIFFIFLQTMPRQIISMFGGGDELYYEFAEKYLKIYMMLVFFGNIQPVTINYFSAVGESLQGLLVSISRQGAFLIPLLILLPKFWGINGVLYANPIADTLAFIMSVSMVLFNFRQMNKEKTQI